MEASSGFNGWILFDAGAKYTWPKYSGHYLIYSDHGVSMAGFNRSSDAPYWYESMSGAFEKIEDEHSAIYWQNLPNPPLFDDQEETPEIDTKQAMTHQERELIKRIASNAEEGTKTALLILIAHWHRQSKAVSFSEYAAHWVWSSDNRGMGEGFYVEELKAYLNKPDKLRIRPNCSDYR